MIDALRTQKQIFERRHYGLSLGADIVHYLFEIGSGKIRQ